MNPEEQQQVNAAMAFMERQCGNLAKEGAQAAALAESLGMQLNAAKAEIAELKKPKDNVVPITGDAA